MDKGSEEKKRKVAGCEGSSLAGSHTQALCVHRFRTDIFGGY